MAEHVQSAGNVPHPVRITPRSAARVSASGRPRLTRLVDVALVAAIALTVVAAGDAVLPGDVAMTRLVQRLPDAGAGDLARIVNALGATPVMIAIVAGAALTLLALRRPASAAFLLLAAVAGRLANVALKAIVDSPRPAGAQVRVDEISSGWGFPSGHVMGLTFVVGAAVCLAWDALPGRRSRLGVLAAAGAVLLASGFGRVYVGAHWPSDVLGAYLWGGAGVFMLAWSRAVFSDHRRETER